MLAFRKWFLVLALVTLTAALASAQQVSPAFQCVANAGVPPIVRAEGIAELTGDLVLNCTGGYPTLFANQGSSVILGPSVMPQVNIQIFLNTNITSKILDNDKASEALLMIDEPRPAEQNICPQSAGTCAAPAARPWDPQNVYKQAGAKNIWQGRHSGDNTIAWLGVPVDAPGTSFTRIIRITNVRANANQLGVSSTLVPTQIVAFISATGTTSIPINNPQQTVAWIQKGLDFSLREPDGDSGSMTLDQCSSEAKDLFTDPTKSDKYCATGRIRFDEGFASAWKTRFNGPYANSPWLVPTVDQNTPGQIFNSSESGFFMMLGTSTGWGALASSAGVANQGTRLRVAFNNIPAGLRLYVSGRGSKFGGSDESINDAVLVNTAQDGSGAFSATPTSFYTKTSGCDFMTSTKDTPSKQFFFAEVPIFVAAAWRFGKL